MKRLLRRACGPFRSKRSWLLLVIAMVVLISATLPKPSTMFVLSAQAESIDIRVVHVEAARLILPVAWDETADTCLNNVEIVVERGGVITYARKLDGPLYVSIRGASHWTDSQGELHVNTADARFVIDAAASQCSSDRWVRLPANGLMTVGVESSLPASADDLLLLHGQLKLFNRSLEQLFGVGLDFGPFKANALYLSSELPIPTGSRLDNARNMLGHPAVWSGVVTIDMDADEGAPAMQIEMAANALSVDLWAPALFEPSLSSHSRPAQIPDVISLSLGSRLTGDPNLGWIFGLIAALGVVVAILTEFLERP